MRAWLCAVIFWAIALPAAAGCLELEVGDVVQAPHGYIIKSLNAFVVHEDALPSGDEGHWICINEQGDFGFYAPRDPMEGEPEHDE